MKIGPHEEFERFYHRHEVIVRRYVTGMLGDADAAEDVVQETWVRYLRYAEASPPRFDRALLLAVARNVVRTAWRRRRPEMPADLELGAEAPDPAVPFTDAVIMRDLVRRLPYADREVIVLHYALDWPLDDIASLLHLRPSTVKSRLYRARQRLRAEFGTGEGSERGVD
jgi:RNA polymerase sigma-70 factor (ECF subfamily)